jgi:hypothetical protein
VNAFYVRPMWLVLSAVVVLSLCAPGQDKPRVFMAGHGTTNGMTNGSAGGTRSGGGWWAAGRTDSIVDSHDESMELAKNFSSNCPGAQVTVNPDAADYVTSLNRESKAKKGVFAKNNQIQVSNKAGDVLLSSTVRSVATAAKDSCDLILSDFAAHGHAKPTVGAALVAAPAMPLDTTKSQSITSVQSSPVTQNGGSTEVDISSTPPNADIEVDGSFVGNTPSSIAVLGGEHTVKISKSGYKPWERRVTTSKGAARIVAELEVMSTGYVATPFTPAQAVEAGRLSAEDHVNGTSSSVSGPGTPVGYSKTESNVVVETSTRQMEGSQPRPVPVQIKERTAESSICARVGIRTETTDIAGARISEIAGGSVADHLGLHVGYVITSIDGRAVLGPAELETELQNRPPGTRVRVGYMFRTSALNSRTYYSNEAILLVPLRWDSK